MEGRRWEATFPLKENNPKGNKEQVVALEKKKKQKNFYLRCQILDSQQQLH